MSSIKNYGDRPQSCTPESAFSSASQKKTLIQESRIGDIYCNVLKLTFSIPVEYFVSYLLSI